VKIIRKRLARNLDPEAGLTLLEVIIAMMIFAMVAAGVAFVVTSSLSTTRDAKARVVAANLAAKDIDYARSVDDVTAVVGQTTTTTLQGVTYTVTRTTGWISSDGADTTCGSPNGVLLYKHVNERVTWSNARSSKSQVQADTLIAPNGRLTDPAMGTILVKVLSASGVGVPGVTVTAVPSASSPGGAAALTTTPDVTDSDGCTYILKVAPGNYDVSVSKTGYLSSAQQAIPIDSAIAVVAGDSSEADFQYDNAAVFPVDYAVNSTVANTQFSPGMKFNFVSENGIYNPSPVIVVPANRTANISLHPFSHGYSAYAGDYVAPTKVNGVSQQSCVSPDPSAWLVNAAGVAGRAQQTVAASPGSTSAVHIPVPMGVVTVNAPSVYLTAVSATAAASVGDPGCGIAMTYKFTTKTSTTPTTLALPFGTWQLYSGSTAGAKSTLVATSAITLPAGSPTNTAAGVFTLDPRVIAP
jgi:prepilin-type N-terminal cleavage/methylation domain-containing protein